VYGTYVKSYNGEMVQKGNEMKPIRVPITIRLTIR